LKDPAGKLMDKQSKFKGLLTMPKTATNLSAKFTFGG
jgi:hypothetical protein